MRNSVLPIPWTQRDSRPRSQAELDEEEQFDIYKAKHLAVPRYCRTELDRLLDHYQDMMSRMIEDPGYVYRINMESDFTRQEIKRAEASLARLRAKPLYKKGAEPREPKPEAMTGAERQRRYLQRHKDPAPPPPYFEHLTQIHERESEEFPTHLSREDLLDPALPAWLADLYHKQIVAEIIRQKEGSLQ